MVVKLICENENKEILVSKYMVLDETQKATLFEFFVYVFSETNINLKIEKLN